MNDREEMLARIENWWNETSNPLYVWQALAQWLNSDPFGLPFPDFCREYLKEVATKMTLLSWGRDFRESPTPKIDPKSALGLVPEALGLGRERQKNMFVRLMDDNEAMRAANGTVTGYKSHKKTLASRAKENLSKSKNISEGRASKIIAHGHHMSGLLPNKRKSGSS